MTSRKSGENPLHSDLKSFASATAALEALEEDSEPTRIAKCLTRLLHYLRKIEQDDFERRDALDNAIAIAGQKWLRDHEDKVIKERIPNTLKKTHFHSES